MIIEYKGEKYNIPADVLNQYRVEPISISTTRKPGGGRPSALDPDGVETARDLLKKGKTPKEIARVLHCSERTIRRVQNNEHKFS